ncbi:ankyrin repeat domain-containing protein [Streptomyces sp. NPDC096339]|uniref:ankyrin repeat domain-containing protein n=1 Tax=Streptomyces sp. NPDC096339 TaxID=3366086 RepID=UPI0038141ED6
MTEPEARLVGAVAAGDAQAVLDLPAAGADPDAAGGDGLPVLCAAVAAYAAEAARALVEGGADPDRVLPDGTTPLLRAVEGGSPAVVSALLGDARPRLPEAEQGRLLAAARQWYEEGAEARLRRLTGAAGPADTGWARDAEYEGVAEVALAGRTVRAGHGAVLTLLEREFGVLPPVEELVARGVRHEAEDHVDRSAAVWVLLLRESAETWRQVVGFHRHPSAAHRGFVADFLSCGARMSTVLAYPRWYAEQRTELLSSWADAEPDAGVLALVLGLLAEEAHPRARDFGLRHARHPDPRVRRRVPPLFDRPLDAETARAVRELGRDADAGVRAEAPLSQEDREALIVLLRDEDPEVRARAVYTAGHAADRTPRLTEALMELLDSDEQETRLAVAFAVACRDDPRTPEAYARVGPLGPELAGDHRADGLWRWRHRNRPGP